MFRIGTRCADNDEFSQSAITPRCVHYMQTHRHVFVKEIARIALVRSDTAYSRSQVEQYVWTGIVVELFGRFSPSQVVVPLARHEHITHTTLTQLLNHEGAEKAGAAGNRNSCS